MKLCYFTQDEEHFQGVTDEEHFQGVTDEKALHFLLPDAPHKRCAYTCPYPFVFIA